MGQAQVYRADGRREPIFLGQFGAGAKFSFEGIGRVQVSYDCDFLVHSGRAVWEDALSADVVFSASALRVCGVGDLVVGGV